MPTAELPACDVERRKDGTVLVRVHSSDRHGSPLPDAVFTFRQGDPQYDFWASRIVDRATPQRWDDPTRGQEP
jgi:hypothetical protein